MDSFQFSGFIGIVYALSSVIVPCQTSIVSITHCDLGVCTVKRMDVESLCVALKHKCIQRVRGGSDVNVDEFENDNAVNAEDQYSGLQSDKEEEVEIMSDHLLTPPPL